MAFMSREDRDAGAGPMHTVRSASFRWGEPESAVECTATVSIFRARQARSTRAAISPRLATRIRRNMRCILTKPLDVPGFHGKKTTVTFSLPPELTVHDEFILFICLRFFAYAIPPCPRLFNDWQFQEDA